VIRFVTFPRSERTAPVIRDTVVVFEQSRSKIGSDLGFKLSSDEVLSVVRGPLEGIGYAVEKDKTSAGKIKVPVLFGLNGESEKTFDADAFHSGSGVVLEVEAGRAVTNYQFLKDLFQACMMQEATHLVIAVRNIYGTNRDFDTIRNFFETLYVSGRLRLPLKSVTIIGY
jgi:hypothetical protein